MACPLKVPEPWEERGETLWTARKREPRARSLFKHI